MSQTQTTGVELLETLELPIADGQVHWDTLSVDQLHQIVRGIAHRLDTVEPCEPTDGVLHRSVQLEDTVRALSPLQHRYAGLLQDAFNTPKLRATLELPKGKTPFRDAGDLLAKTHGLRAYEATGRLKIAAAMTPARASDPDRDDGVAVGQTKYPQLGTLQQQGHIHPSKLSTALNMLTDLDQNAQRAGKDKVFRNKLQAVVEKDLAEKIEHTTPEEFSRYVSRRKTDLLAAMDPPDKNFTQAQTEAMHNMRYEGTVRGNPNAHKWSVITDAEGNEAFKTIEALANNPRARKHALGPNRSQDPQTPITSDDDATADTAAVNGDTDAVTGQKPFDTRTRGQRAMHALRDAIKFAIGRIEHTKLPGAGGNHTQLIVTADYPTLMQHLRDQMGHLLPEIDAQRREMLLKLLAETELATDPTAESHQEAAAMDGDRTRASVGDDHDSSVIQLPTAATQHYIEQAGQPPPVIRDNDWGVAFPPPKTTNLVELIEDGNLDRLQPRISQGMYTPYFPPELVLRLLCDVSISPITLTGDRQVLSIGRKQREFPEHIRRAILARDRGCAVPGCHWPAAWCEIHHIIFWSKRGETSTENGVALCPSHHSAVHAKMLTIRRINGKNMFIQHPLIDPTQQPRENYFWQN